MTIVIEIDNKYGVNWKPGKFQSRIMTRVWWLWFAIAVLHIPLHEFGEQSFQWIGDKGKLKRDPLPPGHYEATLEDVSFDNGKLKKTFRMKR